jgi:hypothetical protein
MAEVHLEQRNYALKLAVTLMMNGENLPKSVKRISVDYFFISRQLQISVDLPKFFGRWSR